MQNTFKKLPAERQTAILEAAASVFAQKGFYQANVADICSISGISNGALYKYFKNKEELFVDVFQYITDTMILDLLSADILDTHDSFYDALYNLLQAVNRIQDLPEAESGQNRICVYLDIGSRSMNNFALKVSRNIELEAKKFWMKMVEKGLKSGEIDASIDVEKAAYLIDNNFMMFVFSYISEHYRQRFDSYLAEEDKILTADERMALVMDIIHFVLR